jgi:hypothetical protein
MNRQQAEAVFNAFADFSAKIHAEDARRKNLAWLRDNARRECGNCDHWMKSSLCPIDDQRRGFPSVSHPPCGKFVSSSSHLEWIEKYRAAVSADEGRK